MSLTHPPPLEPMSNAAQLAVLHVLDVDRSRSPSSSTGTKSGISLGTVGRVRSSTMALWSSSRRPSIWSARRSRPCTSSSSTSAMPQLPLEWLQRLVVLYWSPWIGFQMRITGQRLPSLHTILHFTSFRCRFVQYLCVTYVTSSNDLNSFLGWNY